MPHRLDHSSYATGVEDFAEHYPLGRAQFSTRLLELYPDEPTPKTHKQVGDANFLKALV